MIVLDTNAWIWWVDGTEGKLSEEQHEAIEQESRIEGSVGVSAISCWEVAKKVSLGREELELSLPVDEWIGHALSQPGVALLPLSPEIAVASTRLPDVPMKDPADQIIIATARAHDCPLVTADTLIRAYPHVVTI